MLDGREDPQLVKSSKMENWYQPSTSHTYEWTTGVRMNSEQLGFKWQWIAGRSGTAALLTVAA